MSYMYVFINKFMIIILYMYSSSTDFYLIFRSVLSDWAKYTYVCTVYARLKFTKHKIPLQIQNEEFYI